MGNQKEKPQVQVSLNMSFTKDGLFVSSSDGSISGEFKSMELGTVITGLQQLQGFKRMGCSANPEELEWEIKLYEWILGQPDALEKASSYLRVRNAGGRLLSKREVVEKLGWKI